LWIICARAPSVPTRSRNCFLRHEDNLAFHAPLVSALRGSRRWRRRAGGGWDPSAVAALPCVRRPRRHASLSQRATSGLLLRQLRRERRAPALGSRGRGANDGALSTRRSVSEPEAGVANRSSSGIHERRGIVRSGATLSTAHAGYGVSPYAPLTPQTSAGVPPEDFLVEVHGVLAGHRVHYARSQRKGAAPPIAFVRGLS